MALGERRAGGNGGSGGSDKDDAWDTPVGNASLLEAFPTPPLHKPLVDILMIDTEGNDPKALQGASELLAGKGAKSSYFRVPPQW